MDQYLVPGATYIRLRNEWNKHGSLTIAYDFDSTVFDYHQTGESYDMVIELLRELKAIGCKVVCWTAQKDLLFVESWLKSQKIPCDGVNDGGIELPWKSKKPFFSALLDDRAGIFSVYQDLKTLVNYVNYTNPEKYTRINQRG